jgi:hypothetical protein
LLWRFSLSIVFLTTVSSSLIAQSYVGLNVDNDLYFGIDRYYSSGIFLEFGVLVNTPKDSLSKWGYVSRHWTLGQEINTPSLRQTEIISEMDYPYNGSLFLGYKKERFQHPDLGYGWGIQFGTSGANASLAKFLQNTYHTLLLNLKPLTWAFSLPQAFHLNGNGSFYWGKKLGKATKWVTHNHLQLGTFRTSLRSRFGLQVGKLPGLPFFGNRLEQFQNGVSFFLGMVLEYSTHDYSLSGSAFRNNTPFQLQAIPFRNIYQAGLIYFRSPLKLHVLLNNSSAFIEGQRYNRHPYLNITLSYLF